MKIYNRTKIPDEIIKPIIKTAARFIGLKQGDIHILLKQRRVQGTGGMANQWRFVRNTYLTGKYKDKIKFINCWPGLVEINIGDTHLCNSDSILKWAERIWEVCVHEFCHIVDFKNVRRLSNEGTWAKREVEISVFNQLYDKGICGVGWKDSGWHKQVKLPAKAQDAIINLAIYQEEKNKGE